MQSAWRQAASCRLEPASSNRDNLSQFRFPLLSDVVSTCANRQRDQRYRSTLPHNRQWRTTISPHPYPKRYAPASPQKVVLPVLVSFHHFSHNSLDIIPPLQIINLFYFVKINIKFTFICYLIFIMQTLVLAIYDDWLHDQYHSFFCRKLLTFLFLIMGHYSIDPYKYSIEVSFDLFP